VREVDFAWGATETNQFGTNEYMEWVADAGIEPMENRDRIWPGDAGDRQAMRLVDLVVECGRNARHRCLSP
jgi:alpha-L-arabinofuranosidase